MKKHLIIVCAALLFVLGACDTSEDYFARHNQKPVIKVKGQFDESFTRKSTDSLKIKQVFYNLDVAIDDEEDLEYRVEIDSAQLFKYEIHGERLIIGAEKMGSSKVHIIATDAWGLTDTLTIRLTCFNNLPPVANLSIDRLEALREFTFNASESLDKDARYGGKISMYRFYVNGKVVEKTYHSDMSFTFPAPGTYSVGVEVMDDDEVWSPIVYQTVNL